MQTKTTTYSSLFVLTLLLFVPFASAQTLHDKMRAEYPDSSYIVGIGEAQNTGSSLRDTKVAEVMARVEIARQIKVKVQELTIDIACEGTAGRMFETGVECKNEFLMVIRQTVDQVLTGSRIVRKGLRGNLVFAVAILPRAEAAKESDAKAGHAVKKARENLKKVTKGDKASKEKVREQYLKALSYQRQKEAIEGVRTKASGAFLELEAELEGSSAFK